MSWFHAVLQMYYCATYYWNMMGCLTHASAVHESILKEQKNKNLPNTENLLIYWQITFEKVIWLPFRRNL